MIHLLDISKRYGEQVLFDGLSWTIVPGERIALVGPNGTGKTTLCRVIAGEEQVDHGELVRPRALSIGFLRQEVDPMGTEPVLERALEAFADVRALTRELKALELAVSRHHGVGEGAKDLERMGQLQDRLDGLGAWTIEAEARRVLGGLGFSTAEMDRPCSSFSGGWLMRIELARLLLLRPDVLILDEPTNHLDLPSLEWFEGFLADFPGTLLVVSHDRWFLDRVVNRIAELELGRLTVYTGNYSAYLVQREEALEQLEKRRKQQDKEIAATEKFIERFRYKSSKAKAVQSRVKALEKVDRIELPQEANRLGAFRFAQPVRSGREVCRLDHAVKRYGEKLVWNDLNFLLERGQRLALVGPNGAGKSTLLKMIAGTTSLEGGERVLGHNVTLRTFAQHQLEALDPDKTVYEEVVSEASMEMVPRVRALLGAFLFSGEAIEKKVGVLSGGEKGRLALAKMLLEPANLLLLDEPTNHLDMAAREVLAGALASFEGTLCFISHDRHFINQVATHIGEVQGGRLEITPGNFDELLWQRKLRGQAALESAPTRVVGGGEVDEADGGKRSRKEQRRLEAELRQAHQKTTKETRERIAAVEASITQVETRLAEIEAAQGEPSFYDDGERVARIYGEQKELKTRLDGLMAEWERLGTVLEAADADLKERLVSL